MFGIYRTLLALFVVASHLMSITVIGQYAVHGFFILSGYLMTYIMARTYGYDWAGVRGFCINRFLRLFPSYWALCAVIVPILWIVGPPRTVEFNHNMGIPGDMAAWLQNLSMIYCDLIPMTVAPRLSPPTWALTVELVFYAMIALGASKDPKRSIAWLSLSAIYMATTHWMQSGSNFRYEALTAGSLPFAAGATLFHCENVLLKWLSWFRTAGGLSVLAILFLLNCLGGCLVILFSLNESLGYLFYYLNLLFSFLLVFALAKGLPFPISRKIDTAIGDYSYPVYLIHYPAGLAVSMLLFGEPRRGFHPDGFIVMCASLPVCFILSYLVIRLVDHPVQRVRQNLKNRVLASHRNA
jgi:peptidoglycan/LPS O-acetylase OafA/YrhL